MKNIFLPLWVLLGAFITAHLIAFGHISFNLQAAINFLIILSAWWISLVLTRKYKQDFYQRNFSYQIAPFIKSGVLMIAFVWLASLFLGTGSDGVLTTLATVGIFLLAEILIVAFSFLFQLNLYLYENPFDDSQNIAKEEQVDLIIRENEEYARPGDLYAFLEQADVQNKNEIKKFISENINSGSQLSGKGGVISIFGQMDARNNSEPVSILLSLIRLNDIRRLNRHLLSCYDKILPGGWFVGKYSPLDTVTKHYSKQFPRVLYVIITLLHFLFYRIFPKIPYANRLYFFITQGRHRALSRAEVWGRLHFCGFNVLDERDIEGHRFIIASKLKTPSTDKNPSYYPLIKLDRVGLGGKIIKTHKIRSMYPFSEYLQKRIFEENQLASAGKFKEDFRITGYGKILRKYWLDEIPQLINWLRGDLKLVGIRAMSRHYFSLYPEAYQKLYFKVKPGLVPPLFDERTTDFNEIVETEYRYLQKYLEHPFLTDFYYFWQTFSRILFKNVRSG